MKANINLKLSNTDLENDGSQIKNLIEKTKKPEEKNKFEAKISSDLNIQANNFKKKLLEKRRRSTNKNHEPPRELIEASVSQFKVSVVFVILKKFYSNAQLSKVTFNDTISEEKETEYRLEQNNTEADDEVSESNHSDLGFTDKPTPKSVC